MAGFFPYTPALPRSVDPTTGGFDQRPTADDAGLLADYVLFIVRSARLRTDTMLSADRTQIQARTAANEKPSTGHRTVEERLRNDDGQPPLRRLTLPEPGAAYPLGADCRVMAT